MTKNYKGELVANPYLFSEARPKTRQLLHLSSTSLELQKRGIESELQLEVCLYSYPPPLIFTEGAS